MWPSEPRGQKYCRRRTGNCPFAVQRRIQAGRSYHIVVTGVDDELDESVWGPAPSPSEVNAARTSQTRIVASMRNRLIRTGLTYSEAAATLPAKPSELRKLIADRRLLSIDTREGPVFPRWQFDSGQRSGLLPDIDELCQTFPGDLVYLSKWIMTPNPNFGGRTPRTALAEGDGKEVVRIAKTLTAAGW